MELTRVGAAASWDVEPPAVGTHEKSQAEPRAAQDRGVCIRERCGESLPKVGHARLPGGGLRLGIPCRLVGRELHGRRGARRHLDLGRTPGSTAPARIADPGPGLPPGRMISIRSFSGCFSIKEAAPPVLSQSSARMRHGSPFARETPASFKSSPPAPGVSPNMGTIKNIISLILRGGSA